MNNKDFFANYLCLPNAYRHDHLSFIIEFLNPKNIYFDVKHAYIDLNGNSNARALIAHRYGFLNFYAFLDPKERIIRYAYARAPNLCTI